MEALERDEFLRTAWRVTVAAQIDPKRLVFVDETGSNTSLHSHYAWSKRGERAYYCSVPRNRGKNTTLLASMSVEGMGPSMAIVGAVLIPKRSRPIWSKFSCHTCARDRLWSWTTSLLTKARGSKS